MAKERYALFYSAKISTEEHGDVQGQWLFTTSMDVQGFPGIPIVVAARQTVFHANTKPTPAGLFFAKVGKVTDNETDEKRITYSTVRNLILATLGYLEKDDVVVKLGDPVLIKLTANNLVEMKGKEYPPKAVWTNALNAFKRVNTLDESTFTYSTLEHTANEILDLLNHLVDPDEEFINQYSGYVRTKSKEKEEEVQPITIPEKAITRPNGEAYYPRNIGVHQDVAVLRRIREAAATQPIFALLYGPPGTGKTALVEAAYGQVETVLGTSDTEVSDLVGTYVQRDGLNFEWVDGPLLRAMEHGTVLFLDEIGLIDPKVLSVLYSAIDGRRELTVTSNPDRGVVKSRQGFYVIAATNPNAPGVRLSEALLSRFSFQIEVTTDFALAEQLGCNKRIVQAARNLDVKRINGEVSWAPQLRELLAARTLTTMFGLEYAASNLLANAPEFDRPIVADVLQRVLGKVVEPLRLGNTDRS